MQVVQIPRRPARWVFCLLGCCCFAMQAPAAHRIVLKDGTVIESKSKPLNMQGSYEFTAPDGRFRKIPLEQVDVQSTKAGNDSAEAATRPKVFTNEDFPSRTAEPDRDLSTHLSGPPNQDKEGPTQLGESYWREGARQLREQIEEADAKIASLLSRLEQGECVGPDVECYILAELGLWEARKKELVAEFEQLEERGRKARALPGWFR